MAAAVLAGLGMTACSKGNDSAGVRRGVRQNVAFPVEIAPVEVKSLVYSVAAVGSVDAFEKIQVTARVAGVIDRLLFSEGNFAQLGQILAEIETERFKLAVEAADAAHQKALASLADAEAGLKRRETVITTTPGLIPGEEVETWRTKVLVAKSDVAQAKAALKQASLNLHDAYVRAPYSGIIQTRTVQTGQYVQVGTVLATLVRRDPLLLRFKVPERDAARLKVGMAANFHVRDVGREFTSSINHVAAAADQVSRMDEVTALIKESQDQALRPGSFAEITIPVSTSRASPVIPQTAIRPSDLGFLAFVVVDGKAVMRVLSIGMRTADGQVEVLSGLQPGEILVVRGAEALRNGATVRVIENPSAKAPAQAQPGAAGTKPAGERKEEPS